jgi:hypothetical protein
MATTDDTSTPQPGKSQQPLARLIESKRAKLLQVHAVMTCLREVLLYADGDDAVTWAEAANVAVEMVNEVVEQLDSVHLRPMFETIEPNRG